MLHEHIITKLYFGIDDLSKAIGVSQSKLRFWETEMGWGIHRGHSGKRKYLIDDVGRFALLVRLLKYYHIPAAKILIERGDAERALELFETPMTEPVGYLMKLS